MHATNATQIPASWAEVKSAKGDQQVPNGHGAVNADRPLADGMLGANGTTHTNGHLNGTSLLPASFLEDKAVRTVYGLVPLKLALDWPIWASYNELAGCASWMGGRIPTYEEARSIYKHVSHLKKAEAERKLGKTVPAVNGYGNPISHFRRNLQIKT